MFWDISTAESTKDHRSKKLANNVAKLELSSDDKRLLVIVLHWSANRLSHHPRGQLFVYGGEGIGSEEVLTFYMVLLPATGAMENGDTLLFTLTNQGQLHVYDKACWSALMSHQKKRIDGTAVQYPMFIPTTKPCMTVVKLALVDRDGKYSSALSKVVFFCDTINSSYIASWYYHQPSLRFSIIMRLSRLKNFTKHIEGEFKYSSSSLSLPLLILCLLVIKEVLVDKSNAKHTLKKGGAKWPLTGGVPSQLSDAENFYVERLYVAGYQDGSVPIWDATYPTPSLIYAIGPEVKGIRSTGANGTVSALELCSLTLKLAIGDVCGLVPQRRQGLSSGGLMIKELNDLLDRLASGENRALKLEKL
ncbi:putative DNA ligase (ATP) [Rosa chinensis]|uniref:Putative DNA ligase (ATP) n=1 Tax=Rosa chinensis TaxID=74649 RepID=A0A2P6P988_ROSCH|nr:putative DNA ligase (ATP) [Rosa chinensis]